MFQQQFHDWQTAEIINAEPLPEDSSKPGYVSKRMRTYLEGVWIPEFDDENAG